MGDSSSCDPLNPSNLPANFHSNDTFLCGVSYPQSQPLEFLKICCTIPVEISNDCFQYCNPSGRESTIFSSCVENHVTQLDSTGFKVECNAGAEVDAVEAEESGGTVVREGVRGWKALVAVGLVLGIGRLVV